MLHLVRSMRGARIAGRVIVAVIVAAAFATREASARDGDCKFDVKSVPPTSNCLFSIWCGGAGSTVRYGGITIGAAGNGAIQCCMTEVVAPPHTEIVKGDKKIVHVADVQGMLITRKCVSPVILFWISFGSWTCETDTLTPFGSYSIDSAQDCE
jgi:hypothetical protein